MPSDNTNDKQALIYLSVGMLFFLTAYSNTLGSLLNHWLAFDGNQSHGLLVIALCAYLIINTIRVNRPLKPRPSALMIPCLLLCSLAWYTAAAVNIDILQQILIIPLLAGLFAALLGTLYTRQLLPALGILIFAIPVWDFLVPVLVSIASHVVGFLVHVSKIPALIEGNSFYLPDGKVDIVGGCSGVKYLTIAIVISYYIMITSTSSLYWKATLVAMAIVFSVVMNWIRIFALILTAYSSQMQSSLVDDHEAFGWLLFGLVVIPLILVGRHLPVKKSAPIAVSGSTTQQRQAVIALGAVAALLIGPAIHQFRDYTPPDRDRHNPLPELQNAQLLGDDDTPLLTINGARQRHSYNLRYRGDGLSVEIIDHWQTSTDDKLVPYVASLFDRDLWSQKSSEPLMMADGASARGLLLARKPYGELLYVTYWFEVGPYTTDSYSIAKMLQVPAILTGKNFFRAYGVRMQCRTADCSHARQQSLALANQIRLHNQH